MNQRAMRWLPVGLSAAVVILAGLQMGWLMAQGYEPSPLRYPDAPFRTNNPIAVGEPLGTTFMRCNDTNRIVTTTVVRDLVNVETGKVTTLPLGGGIIDPGCTEVTGGQGIAPTDLRMPLGVTPGRYYVRQVVRVDGKWRHFEIFLRTQEFEVIP